MVAGAPEVVTCGEAMMLLLAEPGVPLARSWQFRRSVAGAESNVAIGLARLGHRVRFIGAVGDDPAGDVVLQVLRGEGVDVDAVRVDPDAPTGLLLRDCHAERGIDVQYYRAGSAASLMSPDRVAVPAGTRVVHVTGITAMLSDSAHATTLRLIEAARAAGTVVSFDPNVRNKLGDRDRWRAVVAPLLARADLVVAGSEELEMLTGEAGERSVNRLRAAGVKTVVVKHPDKSAVLTTEGGSWTQPAFAVRVTDPVGAGDAFAAGLLSAILRGLPPQRTLAEAAAVAALVVASASDIDGLPTAAERSRALSRFTDNTESVNR
ncbi:sugar kinase [Dactylosporangium salmoneum]|uniref:Sugar kinase n=1 Tax=Dactylosporangium salmoneum TaxID=53361 RepID=A0ABN3H1K0_9ACTN